MLADFLCSFDHSLYEGADLVLPWSRQIVLRDERLSHAEYFFILVSRDSKRIRGTLGPFYWACPVHYGALIPLAALKSI